MVKHFGVAALSAAVSLGCLVATGAPAAAQKTINVTFVAGHPPIFPWVKQYDETLIPTVNAELAKTGHFKIDWNRAYGGSLAKVGEEFEAIQQGLADMGQSLSLFEPAKMPLQNVGYYAPFAPNVPEHSVLVVEDLQKKIPAMMQAWDRYNQVYLGGGEAVDVFNLWSKFPIRTVDDLKGHKIGGGPATAAWLQNTGAVHVTSSITENYNNLKTGLIDGVIIFVSAAVPGKYYEVAPYATVVNLSSPYSGGITFNKDRWQEMPDEVKAALKDGVAAWHKAFYTQLPKNLERLWGVLGKTGSTITTMPKKEVERWAHLLPPLGVQWAEAMEKKGLPGRAVLKGYVDGLRALGDKFPRAWDKE